MITMVIKVVLSHKQNTQSMFYIMEMKKVLNFIIKQLMKIL